MTGSSLTYAFIQQLLLFAILICAIFAPATLLFPDMSDSLAAAFGASSSAPMYLVIEMVISLPDQFMMLFLMMFAAAVFVSPVAAGASAYMNDHAFKEKDFKFGDSMVFMGRNYGRLLSAYVLQCLITVGLILGYMIFTYYFMYGRSELFPESWQPYIKLAWEVGILLLIGALQFTPYCCVYGKKAGGSAVADSFRTFFRGGFGLNLLLMILGGVIWLAIVTVPAYIVLLSLCPEGVEAGSLLFAINVPAHDKLLWIVLIVSLAAATLFMFDYCQAIFFSAKRRMLLKYR